MESGWRSAQPTVRYVSGSEIDLAATERHFPYNLRAQTTPGASIDEALPNAWRLQLPPGRSGRYRLAQLDDYTRLPRKRFPWKAPIALQLDVRASSSNISGTWGFGFWNDPFSLSLGLGGGVRRLPALPNAAWFFFASSPSHLALKDHLAAQGFMAAAFRSPAWSPALLGAGQLVLPLLLIPPLSKGVRRAAARIIQQSSQRVIIDPTNWHHYQIDWEDHQVQFRVNGQLVATSYVSPQEPLGIVIWLDNQFAAWNPDGRIRWGTLKTTDNPWIEIRRLQVNRKEHE